MRKHLLGFVILIVAIALGFGSLYNHSYTPNACYEDVSGHMKNYIAIRDIQAGEEVTINYNGDANSTEPVWFDVIESIAPAAVKSAKTKSAGVSKTVSRTKTDIAAAKSRKPATVVTKQVEKKSSKSKA